MADEIVLVPEKEKEGGSFFTGLIVGAAVGAVSLFFFNSKRGKKVVRNIKKEWEEIQQNPDKKDMLFKTARDAMGMLEQKLAQEMEKQQTKAKPRAPKKLQFFKRS